LRRTRADTSSSTLTQRGDRPAADNRVCPLVSPHCIPGRLTIEQEWDALAISAVALTINAASTTPRGRTSIR
jgi:hypothetical protein